MIIITQLGAKSSPVKLCKRSKFDQTDKWYMYKQEFILENNTHKILWDFERQTVHIIQTRRDLALINKKKKDPSFSRFCRSCILQSKNKFK